ncbi:Protein zwilch-like protein [Frankliniella fusca]|uniref:Protein zwilch-like protein n=1 Tax=Frankliniella fusca TaxID=407009 RepID=A0AAE1LTG5_9NEOP|nr:Protein zwilch-like protein [Frankliniella fusca]
MAPIGEATEARGSLAQEFQEIKDLVKHLKGENSDLFEFQENLTLKSSCQRVQEVNHLTNLTEENLELKSYCQKVQESEDMNNPSTPKCDGNHSRKKSSQVGLTQRLSTSLPQFKRTKTYIDDKDEYE